MLPFNYKGLICPVFTPFTSDKKHIDYDVIDKYCQFLKTKGIGCVFVDCDVGELTCLRLDERKRLCEEWFKCCRKHGLLMIYTVGGCCLTDSYQLCEHAERLGVDCVCVLSDLFYKPCTEEDLANYFKDICKYCPSRPVCYYHVPRRTNVRLHIDRFCDIVEKSCNNFCGIFWFDTDIEHATYLLRDGRKVIICCNTTICSWMALGFDTLVCVTLNIVPDLVKEIHDRMCRDKITEARDFQWKLIRRCKEICVKDTSDWIECMKREFNKVHTTFNVGGLRKPICTLYKKY